MTKTTIIDQRKMSADTARKGGIVVLVDASELRKSASKKGTVFSFGEFDSRSGGALRRTLQQRKGFKAEMLKTTALDLVSEGASQPVLVVGWTIEKKESESRFDRIERFRRLGAMVADFARSREVDTLYFGGAHFSFDDSASSQAFVEGVHLAQYEFTQYRTKPAASVRLKTLTVVGNTGLSRRECMLGKAFADATARARDLINLSPRECTPRYIASEARKIARSSKLACKVYDRSALTKMKANLLLSVAHGSDEPPYLVCLEYRPKGKRVRSTISLVGKGVTFDTGGYSLKPVGGMETMKCDMSGAAAVLSAMTAVAAVQPSVVVRGYLPLVENMVSGRATRPGDVVKGMNGTTVEILNTDAEGRLILADAITVAQKDGCDIIIDIATLTGACAIALGDRYAAVFSDDDDLAQAIIEAGKDSGERFWRMPLAPEYRSNLQSTVADLKNLGPRYGGAITAALFLKHFVKKETRWAHLDIAGTAFNEGGEVHGYVKKGGVGFAVRTLLNYLQSR